MGHMDLVPASSAVNTFIYIYLMNADLMLAIDCDASSNLIQYWWNVA